MSISTLRTSETSSPAHGAFETILERIENPSPGCSLLRNIIVERGTKEDWDLLHDLHYKAEGTPFGPKYWRARLGDQTVGVMVTGAPKGLLKERHQAFPKLKPGGSETTLTNTYRYKFINGNFRVISRLVVDTMFRGVGVAYRLQNLASRLEGIRFMEIQSSMSKFNLFAQRAGFRFVKPSNSNKYEVGMRFFLTHFSAHPADFEAIIAEIEALPEISRTVRIEAVRDFYFRHSALEKTGANRANGRSRVDAMSLSDLIRNLQQMTLASPLYGVFTNPDVGRKLPDKLSLLTFDNQLPNEPLVL